MSRGRLIAVVLVVGLAVIGAIWLMPHGPDRRIAARPDIRIVAPEDWAALSTMRLPSDKGWLALPPSHTGELYVAPEVPEVMTPDDCRECHEDIVDSFLETAHARTASLPTTDTILGSLEPPENRLDTSLEGFYFELTRNGDEFLQTVHMPSEDHAEADHQSQFPIAFVIGSGNHGQSFLHWEGDQLCQMHVSYFTEVGAWTNSPGVYIDGAADFARPVTARCLDCHATWFAYDPQSVNRFDKSHWYLGVTCVRCHGPANEHVRFHRENPDAVEAASIINPSSLSFERSNEVCAQCHSGAGELLHEPFSYVPGEPLTDYLEIDLSAAAETNDDPHAANQLGRLMRSRCFEESGTMTCADCHNPHQHERGNLELFARRCHNCHAVEQCGVRERLGAAIDARCVECHMQVSRDTTVQAAGPTGETMPLLRDHLIGIWPELSNRVEERISAEIVP